MERMKINGIEIKEIRDVQDALAAFQTMNVAAESIVEELAKRAEQYTAIIDSYERNHSQYGEMIAALSEEQAKLQQLAGTIDKMSQATALTAQKMLSQFQDNLQQKIDHAFKSVDDKAVHQALQQTIEKSLSQINTGAINRAAESMNEGAKKIEKLDQMTTKTLNEIARSVKLFNETVVNRFNVKMLVTVGAASLIGGIVIGILAHSTFMNQSVIKWTVDSSHQFFNTSDESYYMRFTNDEVRRIDQNDPYQYVKINNVKL